MSVPDVTVVIAVYNTMPYLTDCLDSVLAQTIGRDRLEIIAVNDGSTDDSGAELDRYAERHPGTVRVVHQANSGGPAAPSNRALELATGRYVFFLGADDELGGEALERLVGAADELDADIVLGRLVGKGGRYVFQGIFAEDRDDITLVDSPLPWALSNTKLFRRSMLEEHGIRYPEELTVASDQPFTIRAVVAARRIAVRTGYEFYHAMRRSDAGNITYRTSPYAFVQATVVVMDAAAQAIVDPAALARVHRRHFAWELGKLVGKRFLEIDRNEQGLVQEGIGKLAAMYLTDDIRASLDVQHRIPLSVAQYGTLDDLIAVVEHLERHGLTPLIADGGQCYAALPGFREPAKEFPDAWFDAASALRKRAKATATPTSVAWGRAADGTATLVLELTSPVPDLGTAGAPPARLTAGTVEAAVTTRALTGELVGRLPPGTAVRAEFRLADLLAGESGKRTRRVKFAYAVLGQERVQDLRGLDLSVVGRIRQRRGRHFFHVYARHDRHGRLIVVTDPIRLRHLAGSVARRLGLSLRGSSPA